MENLITELTTLTGQLSGLLWKNPLTLALLLGTGLYLTWRMRFVQISGFRHAVHLLQGKYSSHRDVGEVSHFQALSTALSATVGVGNIAGVAVAISLGGPGAIGMCTKFTEVTLALKFREVDSEGRISGGPMYTLLHGLKMKRLATLFALFALCVAAYDICHMKVPRAMNCLMT